MSDPSATRPTLEQRLITDEVRLERDEARLDVDEAEIKESRIVAWMGVLLAFVLLIAVIALVLSVLALREDVGVLSRSAPDGSVDTASVQNGAITADKLAPGAIGEAAIAAGSVGAEQLARNAVSGEIVARDSLTGADIRERSLATVPAARDAARLGDVRAGLYLSQPLEITVRSPTDGTRVKGPVSASCPQGSRLLSGGAAIEGATAGAAIVASAPTADRAWTATARVARGSDARWRLVVTAICATGGK
jgi:hypothetical protein